MIRDSKAFRRAVRAKLRRAYSSQFAGSLNMLCRANVLLSSAARGYMRWRDEQRSRRRWRLEDLGANGRRGASGSELTATPQS